MAAPPSRRPGQQATPEATSPFPKPEPEASQDVALKETNLAEFDRRHAETLSLIQSQ